MTKTNMLPVNDRLREIAEIEAETDITVGIRMPVRSPVDDVVSTKTVSLAVDAVGKLVELRRRELGLTVDELAEQTGIDVAKLVAIESGRALAVTRQAVAAIARTLDLPGERLLETVGAASDPKLKEASKEFVRRVRPLVPLSVSERAALDEFVGVLTAK